MANEEFDRALDSMGFAPVPGVEQPTAQLGNSDFDQVLDDMGFAPVPVAGEMEAPVSLNRAIGLGGAIIDNVPGIDRGDSPEPVIESTAERTVRPDAGEIADLQSATADLARNSAGLTVGNNPRTTVRLGGPEDPSQ